MPFIEVIEQMRSSADTITERNRLINTDHIIQVIDASAALGNARIEIASGCFDTYHELLDTIHTYEEIKKKIMEVC